MQHACIARTNATRHDPMSRHVDTRRQHLQTHPSSTQNRHHCYEIATRFVKCVPNQFGDISLSNLRSNVIAFHAFALSGPSEYVYDIYCQRSRPGRIVHEQRHGRNERLSARLIAYCSPRCRGVIPRRSIQNRLRMTWCVVTMPTFGFSRGPANLEKGYDVINSSSSQCRRTKVARNS